MNYILKNDELTVTLSDLGAEMISVKRGNASTYGRETKNIGTGRHPSCFLFAVA